MEMNYRRLQAKYSKYRDENDIKPSEARAHIIGELNRALSNCLDLIISSLGEVQSGQGTLYFEKSDQTDPFEFNVLSAGEKEVVDILLDLYLRQDDYNDTVFLIDEPELHINTAIQRKLLIEINKLVGVNCQIWVATHSIGLLRALQDELKEDCQVIYFEPGTDFARSAHTLSPIEKTRHNWIRIFETALDDLTGLVSPKRLVYCEGKADTKRGEECGVDAQAYNNIFCNDYHDTLFVSSGGNTELQQRSEIALRILMKVFRDIEILVLVDRDFASDMRMTLKKQFKQFKQFVSSGGNTELQQRSEIALRILMKVFRDIEILVLVDRDFASGKTTDANDREIYLKKQSSRIDPCQRRSKISPPGRSKTSPLNVMRYAVLGGCPGSP